MKRPASSGGEDTERGRPDPTIAGQVSLVERLHNVQERTASPAKRVKPNEHQQPTPKRQPPQPPQGVAIDLIMISDDEDDI
ncbi:hypothetical protein NX059_003720 [Plenodomus lindquistii]|nr:hypothetical protein NX059_003720 [Plenodomus lindquistii]